MGISNPSLRLLLHARREGVDFSNILMIGRQQVFVTTEDAAALDLQHPGISGSIPLQGGFSERLFEFLGASSIQSMDFSNYEDASIIHDLNIPVPQSLHDKFSLVFDGGTLEHVFNYPAAIKNCMDMVRVGGHLVMITPANNFCGHGFYQVSPELFYSVFTRQHGYAVKLIALLVEPPDGTAEWYEVRNPAEIRTRVTLANCYPTTVAVIAQKLAQTTNTILRPMQSDYAHIWLVHQSIQSNMPIAGEGKALHLYRRYVPEVLKKIVRKFRNSESGHVTNHRLLGMVNSDYFRRMEI